MAIPHFHMFSKNVVNVLICQINKRICETLKDFVRIYQLLPNISQT